MTIALIGDGVGIGANANKGIVKTPVIIKSKICLLRVGSAIGRYSKGSDVTLIRAIGNGERGGVDWEQGIELAIIATCAASGCIVWNRDSTVV